MKRDHVLLMSLGALIGALASAAASGQSSRGSQPAVHNPRLVRTAIVLEGVASAAFIRDTKANACWLEVHAYGGQKFALAPAPVEACEIK